MTTTTTTLLYTFTWCALITVVTSTWNENSTKCFYCRPDDAKIYPDCASHLAPVQNAVLCAYDTLGCITMGVSQPPKISELFFKSCYSSRKKNCMNETLGIDIMEVPCGEFAISSEQYNDYVDCAYQSLDSDETTEGSQGDGRNAINRNPITFDDDLKVKIKYCICSGDLCNLQFEYEQAKFKPLAINDNDRSGNFILKEEEA